jgi:hypothetical protein
MDRIQRQKGRVHPPEKKNIFQRRIEPSCERHALKAQIGQKFRISMMFQTQELASSPT